MTAANSGFARKIGAQAAERAVPTRTSSSGKRLNFTSLKSLTASIAVPDSSTKGLLSI